MMIFIMLGICIVFLIGYILGKRHGWKEGYREAESIVPLAIRQQSLAKGKCMICDENWIETATFENSNRDLDIL
ncbi:hypothetical protein [Sporomusa acidovorans]|uniref:Uncharacterized protein n=1 Tax=Sporomusa acidovorans (strain ATCC 49682 / DSM 3132 / Mol) TaxID=1123286 RepID=A0ABZ3J3M4_SPOA4|nr:hypothetical protein [Sporomusa acidovorans]OZC20167.1 hypothetical protein SPACI_25650 [Sporomusa acidovorans DSM 3132]SDD43206.1 hypothetical protein SAMN04488499_1001223 [Sporomusa acidovorans]